SATPQTCRPARSVSTRRIARQGAAARPPPTPRRRLRGHLLRGALPAPGAPSPPGVQPAPEPPPPGWERCLVKMRQWSAVVEARPYGRIPLTRATPSIEKTATPAYHVIRRRVAAVSHVHRRDQRSARNAGGRFRCRIRAANHRTTTCRAM